MKITKAHVKGTARIVVGFCVAKLIHDIVKTTTNPQTTADKAMIMIGSAVVANMIAGEAENHVAKTLDKFFDELEKIEYK